MADEKKKRFTWTQLIWTGIACLVVGTALMPFAFGYTSRGDVRKAQAAATIEGRVAALAPICAAEFQKQPDAAAKIAALKAENTEWSRQSTVQKSGFATLAGMKEPDSDVAKGCAKLLIELPAAKN